VGFLDRFRPPGGLEHPEAEQRLQAVDRLATADLELLEPVAKGDADARVRRAAVRRVRNAQVLAEAARGDADPGVREAALAALVARALGARDDADGLPAVEGIDDPKHLTTIARSAALESIALAALGRISDERGLAGVARQGEHAAVRQAALEHLKSAAEISHVALRGEHRDTSLLAVERIDDPGLLESIASRARLKPVARRARARLRGSEGDEAAAAETARPGSDRAAQ
jgi:exonuclease SbcC